MALELADSNEKLASPANTHRYGYLTGYANNSLPLGFAIDTGPSPDKSTVPWVGMTCANCHTGEITYQGKRFRVDGAPTLADFETFFDDLVAALKATNDDQGKFDKFAAEVLGAQLATGKSQLKADLQIQADWYSKVAEKNRSSVHYGHGRLDAQGHILNKVSLVVGAQQQLSGFPSDAPASYPFLWYTPQQELVQWNGLVPQDPFGFGAKFRNIGEVIGVFASLDVASDPTKYPSSARNANLDTLEGLVEVLKPPRWPEQILPKLGDPGEGEKLFKNSHCAECHNSINPTTGEKVDPNRDIAQMQPFAEIGTDIWLACNTYEHTSKSGILQGRAPVGRKEEAKTSLMLTNMVFGVYGGLSEPPPAPPSTTALRTQWAGRLVFGSTKLTALQRGEVALMLAPIDPRSKKETECQDDSKGTNGKAGEKTLGYKGGPLNGIWATAPYLHNGSVPTLADLLLPPSRRPTTFHVGGTEFDPDRVGFKSGPQDGPFEFRVRDANGKVIPGNDNGGHEYGTTLDETQRKALLEYLKSL